MGERINQPQPRIDRTVDPETEWLAKAISEVQTKERVNSEQAILILFVKTLRDLKDMVAGSVGSLDLKKKYAEKISSIRNLYILAKKITGNSGIDKLKKLGDSNKFRPLGPIEANNLEINAEKASWANRTKYTEPTDLQLKDLVIGEKAIDVILERLLKKDGEEVIRKIANTKDMTEKYPELGADLGKIFQALDLIELHMENLMGADDREEEKRVNTVSALSGLQKRPALN